MCCLGKFIHWDEVRRLSVTSYVKFHKLVLDILKLIYLDLIGMGSSKVSKGTNVHHMLLIMTDGFHLDTAWMQKNTLKYCF